jgi:fibronectin-binding autotransporter adhesin
VFAFNHSIRSLMPYSRLCYSHLSLLVVSLLMAPFARSQTLLTWDIDPAIAGIANGTGTWNTTNSFWYDAATSTNVVWPSDLAAAQTTIAQFGGGAAASASTVTLAAPITAGGINFLGFTNSPLAAGNQYGIAGSTLTLADNAVIQLADNTSTGSIFVGISSNLTAKDLTLQKSGGTATQFINLGSTTSALTGTLTLKGNNGGLFVKPSNVSSLARVVVETGSTFNVSLTAGSYSVPITIAGFGSGGTAEYGAMRIDSSNINFSGPITLSENAGIRTNIETMNTVLSGPISEMTSGTSFSRFAVSGLSGVTYSGASTYTGATTFGRVGGNHGGINILDFSATGAPAQNILYNGVNAAPLNMIGGTSSTTALVLRGAALAANSQSFGNLAISGVRNSIALTSGAGGSTSLTLGTINRTATATTPSLLAFTLPASGSITTTTPDGFLGTWATQVTAAGRASWAAIQGGAVTGFEGDLTYTTGSNLSDLSPTPEAAHFRVDGTSTGTVSPGSAAVIPIGTATFADITAGRVLDIGAGRIVRFAAPGGVQVLPNALPVTLGVSGAAGTITSGTATANSAGQTYLTNFSSNLLTVNSVIANNGSGANVVVINGAGPVLFNGANTYSGQTTVGSGTLEITTSSALGTTAGGTQVVQGAALRLNGDLTYVEPTTVGGSGVANDGVFRAMGGIPRSPGPSPKRILRASTPIWVARSPLQGPRTRRPPTLSPVPTLSHSEERGRS